MRLTRTGLTVSKYSGVKTFEDVVADIGDTSLFKDITGPHLWAYSVIEAKRIGDSGSELHLGCRVRVRIRVRVGVRVRVMVRVMVRFKTTLLPRMFARTPVVLPIQGSSVLSRGFS